MRLATYASDVHTLSRLLTLYNDHIEGVALEQCPCAGHSIFVLSVRAFYSLDMSKVSGETFE